MILVFGGTGFVGKNLLLALARNGEAVRVVSRQPDHAFLDRFAPEAEATTLDSFHADPRAVLQGCRAVIYLASTSTPGANLDAPWHEARDTVEAAMRAMAAVARYSEAQFVYLSSGGTVYGPNPDRLISEDAPLCPISPYGLGKKMTEAAVSYMAATHGLRPTILRPANPVGRWQLSLSQGVVGALMRAARNDTAFTLIGDGSAVRDYFDVADLVQAIIAAVGNPAASVGQVLNVGSGTGHSVTEMVDLVRLITGREIRLKQAPPRSSDVDRVVLDISRIKERLNWRPCIALDDSLRQIWGYHVGSGGTAA